MSLVEKLRESHDALRVLYGQRKRTYFTVREWQSIELPMSDAISLAEEQEQRIARLRVLAIEHKDCSDTCSLPDELLALLAELKVPSE